MLRPALVVLCLAGLVGCEEMETSLYPEAAALLWQPAEANTIVSFTFDDAYASHRVGAQILAGDASTPRQDSFRGTFFVVSGYLRRPGDGAGRLSPDDVREMYAEGHEIGGHTLGHVSLSDLADRDPYELRRQICNDRRALEALGVNPVGFAYPLSDNDGAEDAVRECGYAYARDADGLTMPPRTGAYAETVPPGDPYEIDALPSISATAPSGDVRRLASQASSLRAWIEHVRDSGGGWITVTIHHLEPSCDGIAFCMEEAELRAIVAWLRTRPSRIAVRTMAQAMLGDALVANPSFEKLNASASPVRPLCFKRVGLSSNFPAISAPGPGRTGGYAEILRPTAGVPRPGIEIDRLGRACPLPVLAGRRYDVRAFVRRVQPAGGSGTASAQLTVAVEVDGAWQSLATSPSFAAGTSFAQIGFVTPPMPDGATAMVFGVQYASSTGTRPDLHVDDLSVVER